MLYQSFQSLLESQSSRQLAITEPLSPQNTGDPFEHMPVDQIANAETEFDRIYESPEHGMDFFCMQVLN